MKKKALFWGTAVLVVCLLFATLVMAIKTNGKTYTTYKVTVVEIEDGDTAWELAKQYRPASMDTRGYLEILQKSNNDSLEKLITGNYVIVPLMSEK